MATNSTIPTVKARLVTVFTTALATSSPEGGQVQVSYAWPGPDADPETVFLGRHPGVDESRIEITHDIPTIKSGRKQRQEDYSVQTTIWVVRPDLNPRQADVCESRAFTIFADLEDELADDPEIGLSTGTIMHASVGAFSSTLDVWEKGWVCELLFDVDVSARLR